MNVHVVFEAVGKHSNKQMSDQDLEELEINACPSAGACGGQFTANTMACVSEAIGLALPYSSRNRLQKLILYFRMLGYQKFILSLLARP